jgi:hypothetical protein
MNIVYAIFILCFLFSAQSKLYESSDVENEENVLKANSEVNVVVDDVLSVIIPGYGKYFTKEGM